MIVATNFSELSLRIGFPFEGIYSFMKCGGCGEFALYQDEIVQFLLTPDLKTFSFDLVGHPPTVCPRCDAVDALIDCVESDRDRIKNSAWAFAL